MLVLGYSLICWLVRLVCHTHLASITSRIHWVIQRWCVSLSVFFTLHILTKTMKRSFKMIVQVLYYLSCYLVVVVACQSYCLRYGMIAVTYCDFVIKTMPIAWKYHTCTHTCRIFLLKVKVIRVGSDDILVVVVAFLIVCCFK